MGKRKPVRPVLEENILYAFPSPELQREMRRSTSHNHFQLPSSNRIKRPSTHHAAFRGSASSLDDGESSHLHSAQGTHITLQDAPPRFMEERPAGRGTMERVRLQYAKSVDDLMDHSEQVLSYAERKGRTAPGTLLGQVRSKHERTLEDLRVLCSTPLGRRM